VSRLSCQTKAFTMMTSNEQRATSNDQQLLTVTESIVVVA